MEGIDFTKATIAGVSAAKASGATDAMKEKATKTAEYAKIKESMAPSKADPKAEKMSKAMKEAYIKDTMNKISGGAPSGNSSSSQASSPAAVEQERVKLISKLKDYYELPRFQGRARLHITPSTSTEALKAEVYDLEYSSVGGGELFFAGCTLIAGALEAVSKTRANVLRFNLCEPVHLADVVGQNPQLFEGPIEILKIKYKDMFTVGPWGALAGAFVQAAMLTNRLNNDPEYRKEFQKQQETGQRKLDPELEAKLSEKLASIRTE